MNGSVVDSAIKEVAYPSTDNNDKEYWISKDKVYESLAFDKFLYLKWNRLIKNKHVMALVSSYKQTGLMMPGLVWINKKTGKFFVVEGQHRKEACKILGIPFRFYIMYEEPSVEFLALLNSHILKWKNSDFLNSHKEGGKAGYILVDKFINKENINIDTFLGLIDLPSELNSRKGGFTSFQRGELNDFFLGYDFENLHKRYTEVNEIINLYSGGASVKNIAIHKRTFILAYIEVSKIESFNKDRFIEKIITNPHFCLGYRKQKDFVKNFLQIYNKGEKRGSEFYLKY